MSEIERMLEQYLKAEFRDKTDLSITRLDKLADGWESDNYLLAVEYGGVPRTHSDRVWHISSGAGSQAKARREFNSFEAIACARRLLDLTVSLTQDAQRMWINAQATEAMRANMEAHRLVHPGQAQRSS